MSEDKSDNAVWIMVIFGFVGTLAVQSYYALVLEGRLRTFRNDAVQRGYAEWVVDEEGEASWQWRGEKQ
jgi:hypothetical protein